MNGNHQLKTEKHCSRRFEEAAETEFSLEIEIFLDKVEQSFWSVSYITQETGQRLH
jgi:hypothetical protein